MSKHSSTFYLHAKKSLGQNFLADKTVLDRIVQAANDFLSSIHSTQPSKLSESKESNLLEIGPGTGALTKALLDTHEQQYCITAVEKDHRAIKGLSETLATEYPTRFILHDADILQYSPSQFDLCIGNIPYYITSDILMWLCAHKTKFLGAIFMLQDEVADRLCASVNTKEYSRLTIKMQLDFKITKLFKVPKESFVPQPKVNSAVVLFVPNNFSFLDLNQEHEFESFTTLLFSQRRKMLRRILFEYLKHQPEDILTKLWHDLSLINIKETDRPESISPQNMLDFFYHYKKFK